MAEFFDTNVQLLDDSTAFLTGGEVFFGLPNTDPTVPENQIDIFNDRDLSVALPNPIAIGIDGRTLNKVWIPARYSFEIQDKNGVKVFEQPDQGENPSTAGIIQLSQVSGTNAITAEASPAISSYVEGQIYILKTQSANTIVVSPPFVTLDIDGIGAKVIKFNFDEQVKPGMFQANQEIQLIYNSTGSPTTDFFSWINSGRGISILTDVDGDGNAVTAKGGPSTAGYIAGQVYQYKHNIANTGSVTLKVGSLPVVTIKKQHDRDIESGDFEANQIVMVVYSTTGPVFELISETAQSRFFIKSKMCIPFFDVIGNIPAGYVLCDGTNGTPDLVGRFIRGSNATGSNNGAKAGSLTTGGHALTEEENGTHAHDMEFDRVTFNVQAHATTKDGLGATQDSNNITFTTEDSGLGTAHTHPGNEPPYTNVLWIMKT